jgi:3-oxoadipyl-CoA thiolase
MLARRFQEDPAMADAYICDAIRTPFGRYGGTLAAVRTDDLAALPLKALMERNKEVDWGAVDDVVYGCANQAGEDNRNVARMALLLAGLPKEVPANTVNRHCGRAWTRSASPRARSKSGRRARDRGRREHPRAVRDGKADSAFSRVAKIEDTTIGWRFVNPLMKEKYGIDSMPETAENVAVDFKVARADQDGFAIRSQQRWAAAHKAGFFKSELVPVTLPQRKGDPKIFDTDEHPRPDTTLEALAKLKGVVKPDGTVTAGNASGVNDGACALILASEAAAKKHGLRIRARVLGAATAGVAPRIMGFGPAPASKKLLARLGLKAEQMEVIELNEAFAAAGPAGTRRPGSPDDAAHVNRNGGAIAIGHPLGGIRGAARHHRAQPAPSASRRQRPVARCASGATGIARG